MGAYVVGRDCHSLSRARNIRLLGDPQDTGIRVCDVTCSKQKQDDQGTTLAEETHRPQCNTEFTVDVIGA